MRPFVMTVLVLIAALASGCGAKQCEKCAKDADCASGLACDTMIFVCKDPSDKVHKCAADCAPGQKACSELGNCHFVEDRRVCRPESDADCLHSEFCKDMGYCTFKDMSCSLTSDKDCRVSDRCTVHGECTFDGTSCVASAVKDCEQSQWCATLGACQLVGKKCDYGGHKPGEAKPALAH